MDVNLQVEVEQLFDAVKLVSQARLSRRRKESGQIPISLLLSSSVLPNEVGVNISWDMF